MEFVNHYTVKGFKSVQKDIMFPKTLGKTV